MAEASGTGACLSTAASTNPCPTSASSSLSGDALDSTQDAVAQGNGTTATPTGANNCPLPINTGLLDVDVLCGNASASEDGSGNPTATGTGSIASAALSLSLSDVLEAILGGSLPSASSLCADAPAATTSPGSNSSPLSGPVQSLLGHGQRDPAGQPRPERDQRGRRQRPRRRVLRLERAADPTRRGRRLLAGHQRAHRHLEPGARLDGGRRQLGAAARHHLGRFDHLGLHERQRRHGLGDAAVARGQSLRAGRPPGRTDDGRGRARPQHRHRHAELQCRRGVLLDERLPARPSSASRRSTTW